MSIVLRSEVDVLGGGFSLRQPAVMDLHDNDRFVLIKFDPRTGEFGERVFDTPVSSLAVTATSTYLTITEGRLKRRVSFTDGGVGLAAFGLIGYAIAASNASKAGLTSWVELFRARGVMKRQLNAALRILILFGIVIVVFGVIVAAFAYSSPVGR